MSDHQLCRSKCAGFLWHVMFVNLLRAEQSSTQCFVYKRDGRNGLKLHTVIIATDILTGLTAHPLLVFPSFLF